MAARHATTAFAYVGGVRKFAVARSAQIVILTVLTTSTPCPAFYNSVFPSDGESSLSVLVDVKSPRDEGSLSDRHHLLAVEKS